MATSGLHTEQTHTGGLQVLLTCSFTASLAKSICRLPHNHNACISTKSSSRVFVALYVNAECEYKDKLDEVGVDYKSTKLKITNRLLTNNYTDSPTRGDQHTAFIIYEQIHLYFSFLHLLLETLTLRSTELDVTQELKAAYPYLLQK